MSAETTGDLRLFLKPAFRKQLCSLRAVPLTLQLFPSGTIRSLWSLRLVDATGTQLMSWSEHPAAFQFSFAIELYRDALSAIVGPLRLEYHYWNMEEQES